MNVTSLFFSERLVNIDGVHFEGAKKEDDGKVSPVPYANRGGNPSEN